MLNYPSINPTALSIGPLSIQWYGLMYIIGIVLGTQFCKSFLLSLKFSLSEIYDLISYIVLGLIIGGRLGYVIFYNLPYYIDNPGKIIAIWEGGMSYHGGAIGCIITIIICAKLYKKDVFSLLDLMAIGSTFGVFFGRIGNFINGELYGRVTTSWVGMIFPNGGPDPRHPSQLYEAFFEGFVAFIILWGLLKKFNLKPGYLFSVNCLLYGGFRFLLEQFREPDAHLGFVIGHLTMGQCLSILAITIGLSVSHYLYHHRYKNT